MENRILLFLVAVVFGWLEISAQSVLKFDNTNFDFGEVAEEEGPVDHTFQFVNTGLDSIRILGVKASCGCTTPAWSKEIVPPGGNGFITARYNPLNRPGVFRKSLTVSTSVPTVKSTLFINGSVKPKPRTVEDDLPVKIGNLRMKYRSFNLGKLTTEKPVTRTFQVYNDSDEPLSFLPEKTRSTSHIGISFEPLLLPSNSFGSIIVNFAADQIEALGYSSSEITFFTDEEEGRKDVVAIATLEEYFAPLSEEELSNSPKLSFSKTSHNFGKVGNDTKVQTTFELSNTGANPLNIRQITANCGCVESSISTKDLKPGESATMNVTFDSKGRRGRQYKTVTIFSNDPSAPTQVVTIRAETPR